MAGAAARFRIVDFVVRWLFSFSLIVAIYNPTGYSYVGWLLVEDSHYVPVKIFVGLTLGLLVWFLYAMAIRSMKRWGVWLGFLFFTSLTWALENRGWLPHNTDFLFVLVESAAAAWLAAGLSVTPLRQHISGHVHAVDEAH